MDKTCMDKTCGLRGRRTVCNSLFGLIGRRGRAACKVRKPSGRISLMATGNTFEIFRVDAIDAGALLHQIAGPSARV